MLHRNLAGQRLLALFMLGWMLFNYPLLSLLEGAGDWFGLPAVYVYVFAAWALLILLMARIAEYPGKKPERHDAGRPATSSEPGK
ncbi:MAG TPA: hypothetical protein DHV59_01885 [Oxalobacteraceae bacterium]|nr:hypothetical protein [Oxalobacteraceae bacterium]